MKLILNEEEQMIRDAAGDFLKANAGPQVLRELRDGQSPTGFSTDLWQQMGELGWPGVLIAEDSGGLGLGHVAMGQISEQAGRALAASPLFSTAVVSAAVLAQTASQALLGDIAGGQHVVALALDEAPRHNPAAVATRAAKTDSGWVLNGAKRCVTDGHVAQQLIVVARTSGEPGDAHGLTLFLLPTDAAGLDVQRVPTVDSRHAADVRLNDVAAAQAQVLGEVDHGFEYLEPALDAANAHLAAELLGIAAESFERTLVYLKERTQFDLPIGTFQALQHRAAILWTEIELCKSLVLKACRALDEGSADASQLVSMAKAKTCTTAELATNEGVQMHGGVGMTDEYDIGFFMKRARSAQMLYGDHRYHLDRAARLGGY